MFESLGAAVAVVDHHGRVVFANQTALDMFGISRKESPVSFQDWRRNYRFEDFLGHEISMEQSAVMRALRGERVESEEVRVKFPEGDVKWLCTSAYPFSTMGLAGVLALTVDQTAEVELRRAAEQLQRMETLGAVAAGLTHDFNNILDTILLNVALALRDESLPHEMRARLEQISLATKKAAGLVTRLMQFSRTQAIHPRAVQINDVVREVVRLVHPMFRENIVVKTDLSEGLPPVEADPSQIDQVLINLIVNALDAMPDGGELKISTAIADTSAGTPSPDTGHQFVTISVADTGAGIPEDLQSAIFEPFFTTKPTDKGTGLGLSSAFGIVRQHKGNIKVQSAPGAGATFVVSFPVQATTSSTGSTAA
jgi:two-component system cell cycle sensor histidine kinase/response regulator CckA